MNKKIKILEVVASFQNGGVEQVLYNYFSKMDMSKFDITILTQNPRYKKYEEKMEKLGVRFISVNPKRKDFIGYFKTVNRIMRDGKYDIIHSHINSKSFIVLLLAKLNKIKIRIAHAHSDYSYKGAKKLLYKFYNLLTRLFANEYVACGKRTGDFLFNNKSYIIIPNLIDSKMFAYNEKNRNIIRNNYNITNDDIVIGHVGRFSKEKNQKYLLDLLFKLNDDKYVLMFIGDGNTRRSIQDYKERLNIKNKVIFVGNVDDIEKYYSAMDIFILPSLYEGLPLSIIEAQYSGLYSILSNNITKEMKFIKDLYFVDLKRIEDFIKIVQNYKGNRSYINIKKSQKYDLNTNYYVLEKLYLELYKKYY